MTVDMTALATENPAAHAYIVQLRAEAAENRVKAAESAALARAAETERDQFKTTAEAAAAKVAQFEADRTKTTEADWRKDAAKKHGLTDAQAARLRGKTAEDFLADAAQVAKDFGIKPPADAGKKTPPADSALSNPTENDQGTAPDAENEDFMAKLLAAHGIAGSETA